MCVWWGGLFSCVIGAVVRHPNHSPTAASRDVGAAGEILMDCVTLRFPPIQKECSITLWAHQQVISRHSPGFIEEHSYFIKCLAQVPIPLI